MKTCRMLLVSVPIVVMLVSFWGCSSSSSPSDTEQGPTLIGFFKLDPRAGYLRRCTNPADMFYDDGALDTQPIALADEGLSPGDSLLLQVEGEYWNGAVDFDSVIAVFSSSDTLLPADELDRVQNAIAWGVDYATGTTLGCGQLPTDIPEDFHCNPEVSIRVPEGATHLFICPEDMYYEDNTDVDNDFGVRIWQW